MSWIGEGSEVCVCQDRVVGIATHSRVGSLGDQILVGVRDVSPIEIGTGPTQHTVQSVLDLFLGIKRLGCVVDYPPPF